MLPPPQDPTVLRAFQLLDVNNDGYISLEDLTTTLALSRAREALYDADALDTEGVDLGTFASIMASDEPL